MDSEKIKMLNMSKLIKTFHLGQLYQENSGFNSLKLQIILTNIFPFVSKSPHQFLFKMTLFRFLLIFVSLPETEQFNYLPSSITD